MSDTNEIVKEDCLMRRDDIRPIDHRLRDKDAFFAAAMDFLGREPWLAAIADARVEYIEHLLGKGVMPGSLRSVITACVRQAVWAPLLIADELHRKHWDTLLPEWEDDPTDPPQAPGGPASDGGAE